MYITSELINMDSVYSSTESMTRPTGILFQGFEILYVIMGLWHIGLKSQWEIAYRAGSNIQMLFVLKQYNIKSSMERIQA